jgi:4-amino-4-deoxy-L-arabinose transferase-like glycosyltransferase
MLQSGNWVVPTCLGDLRIEKPPMIYWCQATAMAIFGPTGAAARLPSALGVLGTAIVLGLVTYRFTGPRRALWTTLIFCSSSLVIVAAKLCLTDGVMQFWVVTGQACLACMYAADRKNKWTSLWFAVGFWTTVGLAGLTKGPQTLFMHAVTLLALLAMDVRRNWHHKSRWKHSIRWWRQLRAYLAIPILAVIVLPWIILIHQQSRGFLSALLLKGIDHAATSMEGHGNYPGYYLVLIFGTFFPWSLLLPTAITVAWFSIRSPIVRFAVAAAVGPWLTMEMVWTKLPFYILPAFGGLAFLTADALVRCMDGKFPDLNRRAFQYAAGIWGLAVIGLSLAPWIAVRSAQQLPITAMVVTSAFGVAYASYVFVQVCRQQIHKAAFGMGVGTGILIAIVYSGVLADFSFFHLSEQLAADLKDLGATGADKQVWMIEYKEPSLGFYQGGGARMIDEDALAKVPAQNWSHWIVIDKRIWDSEPQSIASHCEVVATETGMDYSNHGLLATVLILRNLNPG